MKRAAFFSLCLAACSTAPTRAPLCPPAQTPALPPAPLSAAPTADAPLPAPPPGPAKAFELPTGDDPTSKLSPSDVLLQLEYEPSFAVVVIANPLKPFGRTPVLTLYRDGTLIFQRKPGDDTDLLVQRLSENEATFHLEHVKNLGFVQIRSHESSCLPTPKGRMCLSDASNLLLRARVPDSTLREIRNYAGWEPQHQAQLNAIYDRIKVLGTEGREARGVRPYLPSKATLFISPPRAPSAIDPKWVDGSHPWPLPAPLLDRAASSSSPSALFITIDATEARALFKAAGSTSIENEWFRLGDRLVQVTVMPWLPGVDHTAAIERARREKQ